MTALAKIFRATAFRLALAILAVSAVGAGVVLAVIAWQVVAVVDEEIARTIDAEAKGLTDAYNHDGLVGLYSSIEARKRQPGASLYLLTDPAGKSLAGNVEQIPLEVLERHGFIVVDYRTNGPGDRVRQALVRIYKLPPGFLLLVGHDLGDRARIEGVLVRALAMSLVFFAALAAVGALFVARNVLKRIDDINTSAHGIMAGDLTGRLPVSGSGDELDRLAESLNAMLKRIGVLMQGLREVSDNIAHDLRTPLTRLRNHAEAALAFGDDAAAYRIALEKTIEESDALIRIFNALLLIARAEAGGGVDGQTCVRSRRGRPRRWPSSTSRSPKRQGLALTVDVNGPLYVRGNRELIGQTIANLVDNALKYGALERVRRRRRQARDRRRRAPEGRLGRADRRRPRPGHRARGPGAGACALRAARGLALAAGLGARTVARRRGGADARRQGRARGQRAGLARARDPARRAGAARPAGPGAGGRR